MKSDFKSTEKKKKKELLQLIKINHFINEKWIVSKCVELWLMINFGKVLKFQFL